MLFKNPQMLWGLWVLAIPVLIHLLRLRRFRKTPFTNVRLLQQLVVESNRSSQLKKWLLLLARLGLLAALVLAFAQPFESLPDARMPRRVAIYLDNSFSMQAPEGNTTLLQGAVQTLLQRLPPDFECALLTNTEEYPTRPLSGFREILLNLAFTHERANATPLLLRADALLPEQTGTVRELWLISDFQELDLEKADNTGLPQSHALVLRPEQRHNMSLDTAYISNRNPEILELEVTVSLDDTTRVKPLSLFNSDTLIAKSAPDLTGAGRGRAVFSLPADRAIDGAIRISDEGLSYDNALYFTLASPPKIRVYSLGPGPVDYLQRIYTPDEFEFKSSGLRELDFALLEQQHLLILNELPELPEALGRAVQAFLQSGGTLLVVPAADARPESYNPWLSALASLELGASSASPAQITEVLFDHPLYRDVFEGEVGNFEYPSTNSHFRLEAGVSAPLRFQNGDPFLASRGKVYLFTSALSAANSNFRQSPLIVPTFYALARQSLPYPDLYYTIGKPSELDLELPLAEDRIFRLQSPGYEFIPYQQAFARKTKLIFGPEPVRDGNYSLLQGERRAGKISFNYPRTESSQVYPEMSFPTWVTPHRNLESLLDSYQNETEIRALWKWFVILALLFAAAEMILQKFLR